ncbi:glycoside hydrolase family 15 protein [Occallatibacter riparius]|uniref:Glycoside hydrolase family 15 n=1 Tax=Occallatibacter riparius TaxID=1002689 RepID=A0A9J7BNC6_9BACT|nr:glycoside hydrolase family 15 [Occallatibacter riparius]UWZ84219.1 glycoside hydrolase family 15 [Occallatibacter riparius]
MRFVRFAALLLACLLSASSLSASHLVTGNGFGFAVVAPESGAVTKVYAHPYSFTHPDPQKPLSEGIETASFVKEIAWRGADASNPTADYVDDSQVIRIERADGEGWCFMPFGFGHAAVIVGWNPGVERSGNWHVEWNRRVVGERTIRVEGQELSVLRFDGLEESLLLIPIGDARGTGRGEPGQPLAGNSAWAMVSLENDADAEGLANDFAKWRAGLAVSKLATREIEEVEQWRVKPAAQFTGEAERHLWRQSEMMLRIAQSREPNRPGRYGNGLIVASLPDGIFFTPWVRDMAWATVAFARMGHRAEARAALLAYFNARPTGKMKAETAGADYQISVVRYFGDGAEEPFFTQEGSTNIEFDDWGEALWVLGEYLRAYDEPGLLQERTYRGTVYETARDFIAKPLLKNTEKFGGGVIVNADTSIWEEHQKDKKHFAFSTAMAIVGLKSLAEITRRAGDEATHGEMLRQADLLTKGFNAAFIRDGHLHGTLEPGVKNDIDGALLQIINFGVVTNDALVRDTLERMALLKVASGGYRRVRGTYTDPSIYEYWYEQEEFLFVDFNLAEVYRKQGRSDEAAAMLTRIEEKAAADHNIIPEMYVAVPCELFPGKIGDPTGALPMVGYGAGEFILHLLDREKSHGHA